MDSAHRLVELQAPSDLTYLEQNAQRAAREKIDLNFPPAAAVGEDAMRKMVEALVDEYLKKTFAEARKNMSINGMPAQSNEEVVIGEEYEPFDAAQLDRIRVLEDKRNALMKSVAAQRRDAPSTAARNFESVYKSHAEAQKTQFEAAMSSAEERGEREGRLNVDAPKREQEYRQTFRNAREGLEALNKGLGSTVGKLERAVGSVGFLEGK